MLIRAADEAPVDDKGRPLVDIYGQEKYPDTAGLAKMNFILHNKGTGDIKSGNTLYNPAYKDDFGMLRKFDFIVMNPPFSDKDWTDGIDVKEDKFKRFDGYDTTPPEKNGDFAWFLHVLKALDSKGKAGIILPHGVLFRGNAEETIRRKILDKKYIKGIIGLPANLFYGTGIPASILIIDKENADERNGLFMIDASLGFKKEGNKNRLREQDIEKIVQTFINKIDIEGYSRFVTYDEILEKNDGNLNVPRYITKIDTSLPQNIYCHLNGGIPYSDIASVKKLWNISPKLMNKIFTLISKEDNIYKLAVPADEVENIITDDDDIQNEKSKKVLDLFYKWRDSIKNIMLSIDKDTKPKELIRDISIKILNEFENSRLLDNYEVYDYLLNYWNEKLQDDVYVIKFDGYESAKEIEYVYAQKKSKDENGDSVTVDDKTKVKSFDGALIPREIIENEYFKDLVLEIDDLVNESGNLQAELDEMREEESDDDGLLVAVLNEKSDGIPKANLTKRINELEKKKVSDVLDALEKMLELFDLGNIDGIEILLSKNRKLENYELKNKNGKFGKTKIKVAIKLAIEKAEMPDIYLDEYNALLKYQEKLANKKIIDDKIKVKIKELDELVVDKYSILSMDEIKYLLFDKKWMTRLENDVEIGTDEVLNTLASRLVIIAKRYECTLGELEEKTEKSKNKVKNALERMGYTW